MRHSFPQFVIPLAVLLTGDLPVSGGGVEIEMSQMLLQHPLGKARFVPRQIAPAHPGPGSLGPAVDFPEDFGQGVILFIGHSGFVCPND